MNLFLASIAGLAVLLLLVLVHFARQTRRLATEAEQTVPRAGQVVPVSGGAMHFVEDGPRDAQPIVLIHGLSGQLQHMTYGIAGQLSDKYRVIALDRPGCGYSERDNDDLGALDQQARMIWELLDQLGVENPVLAGHSLGGAVSLAMALQRPGAAAALALICPGTHPEPAPSQAFKGLEVRSPRMRRLLGATLAVPLARKTASEVLAMVFAPEPCPDGFLDRGGAALGLRPKAFVTASADYVAFGEDMPGQAARYGELSVPGAVLFAADDTLLSPDRHGKPMQKYGLGYEELPGRGHMLPITAPDACAAFIRRIAEQAAG